MGISAEFRLAVECCRSCFPNGNGTELADLCTRVDWPRFVRLTRFHRVQGLVWRGLASAGRNIPPEVERELSADAEAIAAANLRCAVECRDFVAAFDESEIPLLFVKGLTLGALAYGNISLKSAVDIDLLIARDKVGEAANLLRSRGYRVAERGLDLTVNTEQLQAWHRSRKESAWINEQSQVQIDLHTRLADNPRLIRSIGLSSPRRLVSISPEISLPTLEFEELFAYLCVHGASSAWFRLKWISDFAALLDRYDSAAVEALYRRSQELGAGRAAAQALLLADTLYGTLSGLEQLRHQLERDPPNRRLHRAALRQLAGRAEPVEPTRRLFGTAVIHLTQLPLMPGWRFPISELARQIRVASF